MNQNKFNLEKIIHPVSTKELLEKYWEKNFLHLERKQPEYYSELFSLADVEEIISTTSSKPDFAVNIVSKKTGTVQSTDAKPTATSILKEYRDGSTIKIMDVGRFCKNVKHFETELRNFFNTDIAINVYMTPPDSQGFKYHYDRHDVFILQVKGSKDWKIYEPPVELPIEKVVGRPSLFKQTLPYDMDYRGYIDLRGKKENAIRIESGDMFFIPRGFIHEAKTSGEMSIHLTVGLYEIPWYEACVNALKFLYSDEILFRKSLPPGFVSRAENPEVKDEIESMSKLISEKLRNMFSADILEKGVDDLASRFINASKDYHDGMFDDSINFESVTLDTTVELQPGILSKTVKQGDGVYLLYSGKYLMFPEKAEEMLHSIRHLVRFQVKDIETKMSDSSKLVLAKHLLKNGFLRVVKI